MHCIQSTSGYPTLLSTVELFTLKRKWEMCDRSLYSAVQLHMTESHNLIIYSIMKRPIHLLFICPPNGSILALGRIHASIHTTTEHMHRHYNTKSAFWYEFVLWITVYLKTNLHNVSVTYTFFWEYSEEENWYYQLKCILFLACSPAACVSFICIPSSCTVVCLQNTEKWF